MRLLSLLNTIRLKQPELISYLPCFDKYELYQSGNLYEQTAHFFYGTKTLYNPNNKLLELYIPKYRTAPLDKKEKEVWQSKAKPFDFSKDLPVLKKISVNILSADSQRQIRLVSPDSILITGSETWLHRPPLDNLGIDFWETKRPDGKSLTTLEGTIGGGKYLLIDIKEPRVLENVDSRYIYPRALHPVWGGIGAICNPGDLLKLYYIRHKPYSDLEVIDSGQEFHEALFRVLSEKYPTYCKSFNLMEYMNLLGQANTVYGLYEVLNQFRPAMKIVSNKSKIPSCINARQNLELLLLEDYLDNFKVNSKYEAISYVIFLQKDIDVACFSWRVYRERIRLSNRTQLLTRPVKFDSKASLKFNKRIIKYLDKYNLNTNDNSHFQVVLNMQDTQEVDIVRRVRELRSQYQ